MHVTAQAAAPGSRVVYVDNGPMVISRALARYRPVPHDARGYVRADIRDTSRVLAEAAATLDFRRPAAVLLASVLHLIPTPTTRPALFFLLLSGRWAANAR